MTGIEELISILERQVHGFSVKLGDCTAYRWRHGWTVQRDNGWWLTPDGKWDEYPAEWQGFRADMEWKDSHFFSNILSAWEALQNTKGTDERETTESE